MLRHLAYLKWTLREPTQLGVNRPRAPGGSSARCYLEAPAYYLIKYPEV